MSQKYIGIKMFNLEVGLVIYLRKLIIKMDINFYRLAWDKINMEDIFR
jgi:hypothetical protein